MTILLAFHVMLRNCGIIRNLNKQTSCFLLGINLTFILQLNKEWDDRCLNMGLWRLGVDKKVSRLTKKLHIVKFLSFIITGQTKLQFLMWHILKHFHINKLNNRAIEFLNIKQKDIPKFDIKLHIRFIFLENTIFDSATLSLHILPFFKIGYMPYILLLHVLHFIQEGKTETAASD